MGQYNGFPDAGVPRPKPTTWQEQQEQNAQDAWGQQGAWVTADRNAAAGQRDNTRGQAQSAYDAYTAGAPSAAGAFRPQDLAPPTDLSRWLGAAPNFSDAGGSGGFSASVGRVAAPAARAVRQPSALENYDVSALENFDPTQYGETYAKGAYGSFKKQLGDDLSALETSEAGTGRLKTGFYTGDQGKVIDRLGSNFENELAQSAVQFSGQRESALQGAAQLRLGRAQGIDANTLDYAKLDQTAASDQLAASTAADQLRLKAQEDQNNFSLDRWKTGVNAAQSASELASRNTLESNRMGLERAEFVDTSGERQRATGLNAALEREGRYLDDYNKTADRAGDYASSTREWAATDRNAQDARDEAARLRALQAQKLANTPAVPADPWGALVDQVNGAAAKAAGVPYRRYG